MKITIITVCFNSVDTIEETLRSVDDQTYPAIEHAIIDGGSTDGTLEIINEYQSANRKLFSDRDKGIYDAMNKGIALATGDVIGFLNSDDIFTDETVVNRIAETILATNSDGVYGDVLFSSPDSRDHITRYYKSGGFNLDRLRRGMMPAHPSLYLKRECYSSVGLFSTHYSIASDFDFILRLFLQNRYLFSYIPKPMVNMKVGGVSTQNWQSNLKLNQEILSSLRDNEIHSSWFSLLSKYPCKLWESYFSNLKS